MRAVLLVIGTLSLTAAEAAYGQAGLPRWLAGCWEQDRGTQVASEMWMAPSGGLMLGAGRTVRDGSVREYEQLILRLEGDRLVYTARPSGQPEASFNSTEVSDSSFTVANPAHDFPQRITYRRRGNDSLMARIEGKTPGGEKGIDYPMRRISCGG